MERWRRCSRRRCTEHLAIGRGPGVECCRRDRLIYQTISSTEYMTIKAGTDARERLEIQFWRPLEEQLTQIIAVLQCIGCAYRCTSVSVQLKC